MSRPEENTAEAFSLLTVCPSFPTPAQAQDGQSIYILEVLRALSLRLRAKLPVLALRLGDQPAVEEGDFYRVTRVEPKVPVPDVFALYEAAYFPYALEPLAERASALVKELRSGGEHPVGWVHGYECAKAAEAIRGAGARVVSVVHYLIADESVHSLAAGKDPVRQALLPQSVSAVSRWTPRRLEGPLVRAARLGASLGRHLPWPPLIQLQLERLFHEARLLSASDRVVAVGREFASTVGRHYPEVVPRLRWCWAGAPPAIAASPCREANARRRVLMVGRPTPQKGWDYAAEALHQLESERPELADRLELEVIGGSGSWRGLTTDYGAAVLRRLHALRRIQFIDAGRLSRDEVLPRYAEADLFLFPSVYEPFGLVLLEALAAGCPILASDADGPREVVSADLGWCAPFQRPLERVESLRRALQQFAEMPAEQLEAKRRAAQRAVGQFSWSACADSHLAFAREASGIPQR